MPLKSLVRQVLLAKPMGKRPKCHPRTRWRDFITDRAWSRLCVETAELSEIAVDREVFRVLLWMLPPSEQDFQSGQFGLAVSVSAVSVWAVLVWAVSVWPFRSGDISVTSVHKQLIAFVYLNDYIGRRNVALAGVIPTPSWEVMITIKSEL